ncbi:MAG: hypothetical protein ABIW31_03130 [Novosphingobium sp.]
MVDTAPPPTWSRFAHWPRFPARVALALLLVLLVLSAITPIVSSEGVHTSLISGGKIVIKDKHERDDDLRLYDRITDRLRHGENYYQAVAIEHRAAHYPLRPGLSVRLPTLAMIEAQLPPPADPAKGGKIEALIAAALIIAILLAWWRRLGDEQGMQRLRPYAMVALFAGVQIGTIGYFFVLHELWAGALLALAMALHRPEQAKWKGALIAAAAALCLREHALPFVLLMAAFAAWHRRWREAAAWTALVLVFAAVMAWHLHIVAGLVRPGDAQGASWLTLRGLSGWMSMIVLSSNLRFLPTFLAGPLLMLMLFGWAGWRSSLGAFATLLFLGYGLAFMIAGRPDNWYWGMTVAPTMWVGLALVPMAAKGLWHSAFPPRALASSPPLEQV